MIKFIKGGTAADERGQIRFVNDFDMSAVKRFYLIRNSNLQIVRGWRGHKIEERWFYVISGAFFLDIVKIDDWSQPSQNLEILHIELNSEENQLLHIPAGYATSFRAIKEDSEILVYADHGLDHAKYDDYTYPFDYFSKV